MEAGRFGRNNGAFYGQRSWRLPVFPWYRRNYPRSSTSPKKLRGYNQSECIARRFCRNGIPIDVSSVLREDHTKRRPESLLTSVGENVDGIFLLRYPERFVGKHILIVDDVLTTGATTTACADALKDVGGVHVNILTLAVAGS